MMIDGYNSTPVDIYKNGYKKGYSEGYKDGKEDAEIKDVYSEGFEMGKMLSAQLERQRCKKIITDTPEIEELSEDNYDVLKTIINNKKFVISFLQGIQLGLKKKILEKI